MIRPDHLNRLDLLDLTIAVVLVLTLLGALRRGSGLLGALAATVATALVLWVVAAAVIVLGPRDLGESVARSDFSQILPPPTRAVDQLVDLVVPGGAGPGPARP